MIHFKTFKPKQYEIRFYVIKSREFHNISPTDSCVPVVNYKFMIIIFYRVKIPNSCSKTRKCWRCAKRIKDLDQCNALADGYHVFVYSNVTRQKKSRVV